MFKGRLLLLLALLVLLAGCRSRPSETAADLSGRVTYKDAPVTAGLITFHRENGSIFTAPIQSDGTYSVFQAPVGEVVATIDTEQANPDRPKMTYGGNQGGKMGYTPEGVSAGPQGKYVKIPMKYTVKSMSPLKFTLKPGKQTENFTLTD